MPDKSNETGRLVHLDGLRGLAILAVLFYHSYSRRPEVPELYTDLFGQGHLGVQMFFLLSGYLIFASLETSKSLVHFLRRRWLRLFPAMVAASLVIWETSLWLFERPDGLPGYFDLLPGLTFVEPHWWRDWLRVPVTGPLEGDFWTLFTEVKFYVLFGLGYFLWRRKAAFALGAVGLGLAAVHFMERGGFHADPRFWQRAVVAIADELNGPCYGWFAAGAWFYWFRATGRWALFCGSVLFAVVGILTNSPLSDLTGIGFAAGVYVLFVGTFFSAPLRKFFSLRVWRFFGFISYPLYLIHENGSWAMIRKLHGTWPALPGWAVPILPMLVVSLMAWIIAQFIEPFLREPLAGASAAAGRLFSRERAWACAVLFTLTGLGVACGLSPAVASARRIREKTILASEQETLEPLERKLEDSRRAYVELHRALTEAQAYLARMEGDSKK